MYKSKIEKGIAHFGKLDIDMAIATQAQLKLLFDAGNFEIVEKIDIPVKKTVEK